MRLCYIADASSIHTIRWVGWFAARGYPTLLISTTPATSRIPGVEQINLPGSLDIPVIKWLLWSVRLRRILNRWQPDIVHAHQLTGAGWLGALSGFHPFIVTSWGSDLYRFPLHSPFHAGMTRFVVTRADKLTVDSRDLFKGAIKYGADPSKIELLHWGVNRNIFRPPDVAGGEHSTLPIVILSLRACTPIYNQHVILEAFAAVSGRIPNARLLLRDFNTDPDYKNLLVESIRQKNLAHAVEWVGPVESENQIADLYRSAAIAISVPSTDSTPVSVLEALACGTPVIASDLPSLREWITDKVNGRLVPPGNVEALKDAILDLISNKDRIQEYRDAGLRLVEERADRDLEMEKIERCYLQLHQEWMHGTR